MNTKPRGSEADDEPLVKEHNVVNRRTGHVKQGFHRRAYDGAYILELLSYSGCWQSDIDAALQSLADWSAEVGVEETEATTVKMLVNEIKVRGVEQRCPQLLYVLQPLIQYDQGDWPVAQVAGLFPLFHEQPTPEHWEQMKSCSEGASYSVRDGKLTIHRFGVIEGGKQ